MLMDSFKKNIYKELETRVLVKDGATGTLFQAYKLEEKDYRGLRFKDFPYDLKGNNDILCLSNPEIVKRVHNEYLEAGADIILTNTFNATRISQADYHTEDFVCEMNKAAAEIAVKVAEEFTLRNPAKPRFVAGSLGPTNKTLSLSPDVNDPGFRAVSFDEVKSAYREQVEGLLDGSVDLLLVETIFDALNGKAALFAIEEVFEQRGIKLPIMVSGTITDASGRTLFVGSFGVASLRKRTFGKGSFLYQHAP
jgi:5-methyltetrahydrofolate--homocysteine methyltransferase